MPTQGETPSPPPSREEVEIRKLDGILELTDARIKIVTPIPGQQSGKKGEADGGDGGASGSSEEKEAGGSDARE